MGFFTEDVLEADRDWWAALSRDLLRQISLIFAAIVAHKSIDLLALIDFPRWATDYLKFAAVLLLLGSFTILVISFLFRLVAKEGGKH